jgi:Cys-rich protein (TIGR01571 family)
VKEGQVMTVPFEPTVASELTPLTTEGDTASHGQWKDGICDCCMFGIFHPSLLNACCFPQLLMAQVLTRMKMNMCGDAAPEGEYQTTFRKMVFLVLAYWIVRALFAPPSPEFEANEDGTVQVTPADVSAWQMFTYNAVTSLFALYSLVLLIKLRVAVRQRYGIPEKRCVGVEDCCCAFWCSCCTVAQVARQTADYDQRRAVCCSRTGLPDMNPSMNV